MPKKKEEKVEKVVEEKAKLGFGKKLLWGSVIVAVLAAAFLKSPIFTAFDATGNGYGSRLACGAVFGTGRSLESVISAELTFPPVKYGRTFEVDNDKGCITVKGKWPMSAPAATSCYDSHRLGCFMLPRDGSSYDLPQPPAEDEDNLFSTDSEDLMDPWPLGNVRQKVKLAREILPKVDLKALEKVANEHFNNTELHARAMLLLIDGEIVFEKYGDNCDSRTRLLGWSATKSLLQTLIGTRIQNDDKYKKNNAGIQFSLDTPINQLVPEWKNKEHLNTLTIEQALRMADGLDVDESYFPGSLITEMLFINGTVDGVIQKAANDGRRHRGENCFHYSSATTNILCQALSASFDKKETRFEHLVDLFHNIRTKSFRLEHDINGHCIGSSFGYATARDWARLALLYQYDGMWWDKSDKTANPSNRTKRILPEGWVEFTKTPTKTSRGQYGAHFWLGGNNTDPIDSKDNNLPEAEKNIIAKAARHREKECDGIFPTRLEPKRDWMKNLPQNTFFMHGFEEQMIAINQGSADGTKPPFVLIRLGASKEKVLNWNKDQFYRDIFATFNN